MSMSSRRWIGTGATVLAAAALAACGGGGESEPVDPAQITADLEGTAPAIFRARFETNEGEFVVEVHREWAPRGADRFYNLVRGGYLDGARFFRVVENFMVQFGIHGDPAVAAVLREQRIEDDPVQQSNTRGRITFATSGANSRTSQMFINFVDNSQLDAMGFAPFGEVVEGMDVVDRLHAGYGDGPPGGRGPAQPRIQAEGNDYLSAEFPELDYIERVTIVEG